MRRGLEFYRLLVRGFFLLAIAGGSSLAAATDVRFVGGVGYSGLENIAILSADQIHNFAASGSGQLRMELWATPAPFTGSFAGGYQTVVYPLGTLAGGASFTNVSSGVLTMTRPPEGLWYVAMVLTEYTGAAVNGGYSSVSYAQFPDLMTGTGSPPPPPTDTTPPIVSLASPTGGNVSGTVTISANASDNVGVTRVDFYVNGSVAGSADAAPWQMSWNTASVANGTATLRAAAYDAAGNSGLSGNVSVTVVNGLPPDTTPPTVSLASPTGGNVSGTVTISANASDNVGVTRVDFYVNGSVAGSANAAPWQMAWNTTSVANGNATLRAAAYDAAGNSGLSANVSVTVANGPPPDTTPPTIAIASPAAGNVSGTVAIVANASDNVGVMRVDFYVNGSLVGSANGAPWQFSWNTTSVANGTATLRAVAYDAAGNSGISANVSVMVANAGAPPPPPVDTTAPTASIVSPTGGSVSGMVAVLINASDNVGVVRVDLLANGKLVATDNAAPWQFSWNSGTVANGVAQLQAIAYDAAGNAGTSSVVALTVANTGSPPQAATAYAIEFYNAALDHYFITAAQAEVDVLDSGTIAGWARTGLSFKVYAQLASAASPVCRIYIPPPYGNSHFFSASPSECSEAIEKYPYFIYEAANVFYIDTPDLSGTCPDQDTPIYRLWNNRADTNHRYTTSLQIKEQMVAEGYIAEGYGPDAVMMCSPP